MCDIYGGVRQAGRAQPFSFVAVPAAAVSGRMTIGVARAKTCPISYCAFARNNAAERIVPAAEGSVMQRCVNGVKGTCWNWRRGRISTRCLENWRSVGAGLIGMAVPGTSHMRRC